MLMKRNPRRRKRLLSGFGVSIFFPSLSHSLSLSQNNLFQRVPAEEGRRSQQMGVLSNKIERDKLQPGDHIYTWRHAYLYTHHGIYVGDGNVIHFTRGAGQDVGIGKILDPFLGSSIPKPVDNPCPKCGDQSKLHGVISSCIDCFLCGGNLYRFEYGVSPAFFVAQARGGTCTLASSDPPEEVVHRASYLLQIGFGVYDVLDNNCEDFAMFCKTGLLVKGKNVARSGQVASLRSASTALPSSLRYLQTASAPGLAASCAVYCASYCISRLVSDMGVRKDVEKVPVEALASHPDSPLNESQVTTEMPK